MHDDVELGELEATPWVDKTITQTLERVEALCRQHSLPEPLLTLRRTSPGRDNLLEHMVTPSTVVAPTSREGVALEITIDGERAALAQMLREAEKAGKAHVAGMPRYLLVVVLSGLLHRKRPIYVIWREDVDSLNYLNDPVYWFRSGHDLRSDAALVTEELIRLGHETRKLRTQILRLRKKYDGQREAYSALLAAAWQGYHGTGDATLEASRLAGKYRGLEAGYVALAQRDYKPQKQVPPEAMAAMSAAGVRAAAAIATMLQRGFLLAGVLPADIGKGTESALEVIARPGLPVALDPSIPHIEIPTL